MITLKAINKCKTIGDLEALEIGRLDYDIGHRGGTLGFKGGDVAKALGIDRDLITNNVGAYVNYLGGGLRGAICASTYAKSIAGKKKELLDALLEACKRAYQAAEDEQNLNNETDEDGETNWEALGTNASRKAGIKSYPGL